MTCIRNRKGLPENAMFKERQRVEDKRMNEKKWKSVLGKGNSTCKNLKDQEYNAHKELKEIQNG